MAEDPASVRTPPAREAAGLALRTLGLAWRAAPRLISGLAILTLAAALAPALAVYLAKLMIDAVLLAIETGLATDRNLALGYAAGEAAVIGALIALRRIMGFYFNMLRAELGYAIGGRIFSKKPPVWISKRWSAQTFNSKSRWRVRMLSPGHSPWSSACSMQPRMRSRWSVFAILLAAYSPWLILLVAVGGLPLFSGRVEIFRRRVSLLYGPDTRNAPAQLS